MPQYRYHARDERGRAVTGTLAASAPDALADQLKRMGYVVTQARLVREGGGGAGSLLPRRVASDELALFNVQLAKMVHVGIPLTTALEALTQQTISPLLRQAVVAVARDVESGESFSDALGRHPAIFSSLFVSMVRAGELSGKLDEILRRLAIYGKQQEALRQQVRTAMTYPLVLMAVGAGVIAFFVTGIIPKFMKIFLEAGVPLPLPTLILHHLSQGVRHAWWVMLLGVVVAIVGGRLWLRQPAGRRQLDTFLLRVPVLGDLARKAAIARMSRSLETLFASGVSVLESLTIAEQTCGNAVIARVCQQACESIKRGGSLSQPLQASEEFPPMVVQMVRVGEASGTLDQMLGEIAEHYDEMVQHSLKRLTTLIEPVCLIVMGGLVAMIMASILLPLFRMVNVIR